MTILEVHNLKKVYTTRFGGNQVQALRNIQFSVEEGEYVAIMGESGSGKTTLLNILAALDRPTEGEVLLNGKNLVTVREKEIAAFRREHLGFVFQDFHLLDNFSLKDNIFLLRRNLALWIFWRSIRMRCPVDKNSVRRWRGQSSQSRS